MKILIILGVCLFQSYVLLAAPKVLRGVIVKVSYREQPSSRLKHESTHYDFIRQDGRIIGFYEEKGKKDECRYRFDGNTYQVNDFRFLSSYKEGRLQYVAWVSDEELGETDNGQFFSYYADGHLATFYPEPTLGFKYTWLNNNLVKIVESDVLDNRQTYTLSYGDTPNPFPFDVALALQPDEACDASLYGGILGSVSAYLPIACSTSGVTYPIRWTFNAEHYPTSLSYKDIKMSFIWVPEAEIARQEVAWQNCQLSKEAYTPYPVYSYTKKDSLYIPINNDDNLSYWSDLELNEDKPVGPLQSINEKVASVRDSLVQADLDGGDPFDSWQELKYDFERLYEDKDIITFSASKYSYVHMGMHGLNYNQGLTFNKHNGKLLDWSMFYKDEGLRLMLYEELQKLYAPDTLDNLLYDHCKVLPFPKAAPWIEDGKFVFFYQLYEIAPPYLSSPYVELPFELVKERFLNSKGLRFFSNKPK